MARIQRALISVFDKTGLVPFARNGAVGYMPIIITLPEGTNMTATGVVSSSKPPLVRAATRTPPKRAPWT